MRILKRSKQKGGLRSSACEWLSLCLTFVGLIIGFECRALDFIAPYKSRLWLPSDDPFRNMVQSVAQTSDGFLWVGTQQGLARFDGEKFEFILIPCTERADATAQRVTALATDNDGGLWVASGAGLFRFKHGNWEHYDVPKQIAREPLLSLLVTQKGDVFAGTRSGLLIRNSKGFNYIGDGATNSPAEKRAVTESIRCIVQDKTGDAWLAAGTSLLQISGEAPSREVNLDRFQPYFVRSICCSRDDSVWAGTHSGLIRLHNGNATQFTKANGLPDDIITTIYEDRVGNLWIGTFNGLCRFHNGRFYEETKFDGEAYDQIFCFFEDHEGNLWVGAKDGLYQLNVEQFTTYSSHQGLGHKNIMSVYEDRAGTIWAGTWGGGLHRLEHDNLTIYSKTNQLPAGNDMILAIHSSRDGSLWFAEDYGGGLFRFRDGKFDVFGPGKGLPAGAVRALLEDRSGKLWVGHASAGLGVFENDRLKFLNKNRELPTNNVRCLFESHDNKLWIGTEAGLVVRIGNSYRTFTVTNGLAANCIYSLFEDAAHIVWVGTENGLSRAALTENWWTNQTFSFRSYGPEQGGISHAVLEILEDDSSDLWLGTRRGVYRIRKADFDDVDNGKISRINSVVFGTGDGMKSQICVGVAKPCAIKSRDGRLWFATTKGIAVTDPRLRLDKNDKAPPVLVRKLIADKKTIRTGDEWKSEGQTGNSNTIKIQPGRGDLEIHYTALSFRQPEENRFKYKLENFDRDWVDAGVRHVAYYNNIPPGEYKFRVAACNSDGAWNSNGALLLITIEPHFWQTLWFQSTIALVVIVGLVGVTRSVTKVRMQRKIRRLEEQHAIERERARIAKDIHDDLGASLTRIAFLGELVETDRSKPEAVSGYVQRIVSAARDTVRSLDEIVWAVNPRNDTLDSLMEYIAQFAHEFFQNTSTRCRIDLPDDVPAIPLSSEVRHNVFLVIKEALNNSLKHSCARNVGIRCAVESECLRIELNDDGSGFDLARATSSSGNGLENMRRRIEDLGGMFSLQTKPGTGTQIAMSVPLSKLATASVSQTSSHIDANPGTSSHQ